MPDYHPPLPVSMEQKTEFEDYTNEVRNRSRRNRLKGLDLIDRVPDELWTEVHDRRQGSRPSPWKRNAKKQNGCLRRTFKFL